MSPLWRMPPSAMMGLVATRAHHLSADSCQPPVPKPVFRRVMQTLPGPTPILVASAPQFSRSITASGVPTLPAITNARGSTRLMRAIVSFTVSAWPCAMSIVMYSGPRPSAASWSMAAWSASFTPTEIDAYTPACFMRRTNFRVSRSNRCIT